LDTDINIETPRIERVFSPHDHLDDHSMIIEMTIS